MVAGRTVYPEQVKEAIYSDPAVTPVLTGHFKMAAQQAGLMSWFQLKDGQDPPACIREKLDQAVVGHWVATAHNKRLVPYQDFVGGRDLCYQHKFRYL